MTDNTSMMNTHKMINIVKGLYKSMEKDWEEYAQKYGLTNAHMHVLWILSIHDGIKLSDLASKGLWNLSTTHDIVGRMASKGLLKKEKDIEDGRITRVYITEKGLELKNKTQNDYDDSQSFKLLKAINELDSQDRDEFIRILDIISENVLEASLIEYIQKSTEMHFKYSSE